MTAILSIQSWVAYGHVGNAAAVLPLQRLGFEVFAVNTVQFSNHTGYGAFRGRVFETEHVREVLRGIEERQAFSGCAAVLSGYLGEAALGEAVVEAAARVKAANPAALWCCDPVIGDVGRGSFVRPGVAEFFARRAVPLADVMTPNLFELEALTGIADPLAGAEALRARGPGTVLVTSLPGEATIGMLALGPEGAFLVETPRLPLAANGAGDATAALFLGWLLRLERLDAALEAAADGIFSVLEATLASGGGEIALVAAQDALAAPKRRFPARLVAPR
jgi:pyridoxine kinase